MAKIFPLDVGETASARNNYQLSEGVLHRATGFYPRPAKGLALRNATEYISTDSSDGMYCGHFRSNIRNIFITVFWKDGEYSFNVYDTSNYDTLIKTITLAGEEPRLGRVGGYICMLELSRATILSMTLNPFVGESLILVTGIRTNLKYLDDDLIFKDYKVFNSGVTKNTPVCHGVTLGQQRVTLYLGASLSTTAYYIEGEQMITSTDNTVVLAFSKAGALDQFEYDKIDAVSAFELLMTDLGASEVAYYISAIKKQVLITTNLGLWVVRSIAEETKPLAYDNAFPYKVDNIPAIPCEAVEFDNNFVLYAATNGIIRVRQYNSLVDVSFPTTDPGGMNMPVFHEEFRGIKKIFYNSNPYLLMILDNTGNLYCLGTSFNLKQTIIIFPRTTFMYSGDLIDGSGPSFTLIRKTDKGLSAYRENSVLRVHQGLQFEYYPKLTVTSQEGREISIDVPHLSQMLIKIGDRWIMFKYNGSKFSSIVDLPDIDGEYLPYVPLMTDKFYTNIIPRWVDGKSAYQFTIEGTSYVSEDNIYDIRLDIDFTYNVSSYFIEEIGTTTIVVESDTLPGLESGIREVGIMWNDPPSITYNPLPRQDIINIIDPERTLYRHAFDPTFSATRNTMTINMVFKAEPIDNSYLALSRIYTL